MKLSGKERAILEDAMRYRSAYLRREAHLRREDAETLRKHADEVDALLLKLLGFDELDKL
jgi:hypothetical protein